MKPENLFKTDTNTQVRTRFAPSPTGFLHVGGARTALYSWLYARHFNGEYVLRIEDTDLERSTDVAFEAILEAMKWLNLSWDHGPYYQTKRFARYQQVIDQMLEQKLAYRCYCSKERLDELRHQQESRKEKPRYDRYCLNKQNMDPSQPHVVRFKNPTTGSVVFDDAIRGHIEISNDELDDLIIQRTDGAPTYNFCVVIDDWDMQITHVIRGEDHINNTPRQINILKALGAPLPIYAHVSMILGEDGQKLSKRHGAVSVMQYRDEGYLPEALNNYLVRLGWGHSDQEIFSREQMIELFKLESVSRSASTFDHDKLLWLNHYYIRTLPAEYVAEHLAWQMQNMQIDISNGPKLSEIVTLLSERCKTLKEMASASRYFFEEFTDYDENAAKKHLKSAALEPLTHILQKLKNIQQWNSITLHNLIEETANELSIGMGKIGMPLRVAVTGVSNSPSMDVTLASLGKDRAIKRIERAISHIKSAQQN